MTTRTKPMTTPAWRKIIQEDIEWLEQQPDTLERKHILTILQLMLCAESGDIESLHQTVTARRQRLG